MKKKNNIKIAMTLALVVLTLGLFGCSKVKDDSKTKDSSKNLIEKIKVIVKNNRSKGNSVIYINLDGFSYDTFEMTNKNPETSTKNINELLKTGVLFTNAQTGIPSITDSMQQAIASGAWPIDTGNCYRYYDLDEDIVVEYKRHNKIENMAEAANRNNIGVLAINAWFFEDKGANKEEHNLYVQAPNEGAYKERFDILKKVLRGEEIEAYGKKVKYKKPPQFISIYADDIDAAGHNLSDKTSYDSKIELQTREQVNQKMADALSGIDKEIGEVIEILKERKLYDKTTFVITTDHGMVPFGADTEQEKDKDFAKSKMPDLIKSIEGVGQKHIGRDYRVEMVNEDGKSAKPETEVIVTTVGLQAQIKFRGEADRNVLEDIVKSVEDKPYYGAHLYDDELRIRGTLPRFADLLVSPKPPYHFSQDFKRDYYAVNQHDSLDEKAQRVFTMISGPTVENGILYDAEIHNIDMAPTITRILGFEGPRDATASPVDDVLIDKLKGPKLEVSNYEGNSVYIDGSKIDLQIATDPDTQVSINKKVEGISDSTGLLVVNKQLDEDINRFVIEVIKDKKSTRKVFFVIKNEKVR